MENSVPKFLWRYARKLKWLCLLMITVMLCGQLFSRSTNWASAQIVETISQGSPGQETLHLIIRYLLLIFFCFFMQSVLMVSIRFLDMKFMPYYIGKMSQDLFSWAHKHSTSFFAEEMAGNVAGKIKTILSNSETLYYHVMQGFLMPLLSFLTAFVFIGTISWSLVLWLSLVCCVFAFVQIRIRGSIAPLSQRKAKLMSESNGILVDSISNSDLVKNCANFFYERRLYYNSVRQALKAVRKEVKRSAGVDALSRVINDSMMISFYLLTVYYWYYKNLNVGDVVLILSLISSMSQATMHLGFFCTNFVMFVGGIKDGLDLLNKDCDVKDINEAMALNVSGGAVKFSAVCYHYKTSKSLLSDFNLSIKPGEKIGLVGRSGAGKSTLVKLLSRYYDVQGGEITIDGQNIAGVTQKSLRQNIALIPQDPSLFNRTIMENIRYGNIHATDEEVYDAARKAYIHDYIMTLPQGYQSKVGERGVMLSGGERQRIAIARAILKNAPILILDEATSALDSESEHYIQEALRDLMKGKTVIAIAHRLSTLKEMNKIVVMDKGKIIESGSHAALLRKKGAYYNFYTMQSSGFLQ
ncbi:MAG: ABC transporter ATP-binding protein [Alphaproteobacteria bacterium]|nr:ABC transporter ATP-binding protein [Alphaproteobacteria bacterium]